MDHQNRRRTRRQLECELQTREAQTQLTSLASDYPAIRRFDSWNAIVEFLQDVGKAPEPKNEILQVLVERLQYEKTTVCAAALLLAFWPALSAIARSRANWNNADDELWYILEAAFLETTSQLDISRDQCNIAGRIVRTTAEYTRRACRREVAFQRRSVDLAGGDGLVKSIDEIQDPRQSDGESRIALALAKRRIAQAFRSGRLNGDDLRLLFEVDYEGASIEEAAYRRGLPYETIKRRRQRLLAKLQTPNNSRLRRRKPVPKTRG